MKFFVAFLLLVSCCAEASICDLIAEGGDPSFVIKSALKANLTDRSQLLEFGKNIISTKVVVQSALAKIPPEFPEERLRLQKATDEAYGYNEGFLRVLKEMGIILPTTESEIQENVKKRIAENLAAAGFNEAAPTSAASMTAFYTAYFTLLAEFGEKMNGEMAKIARRSKI
jgi:hypothetical protein